MEYPHRTGGDGIFPANLPFSRGGQQFSRVGNLIMNRRVNPEIMQDLGDFQGSFQRELEKKLIREEIIAAEVTRRRILEAEVRKELMIEREIALRRASSMANCLPLEERSGIRLGHMADSVHQYPLDGRLLYEHFGFSTYGRVSEMMYHPLPSLPKHPEAVASEVKPHPESKGERLIVLEKPDPRPSGVMQKASITPTTGTKRKASTSSAATGADDLSAALTKRAKQEWRCALCQISTTSERALKEHFDGKKHKGMAEKRGQRRQEDLTLLLSKDAADSADVLKNSTLADQGKEPKVDGENGQRESSVKLVENMQDTCNKSDEQLCQNSQHEDPERANAEAVLGKLHKRAESKMKNYKFWCDVCRVGTSTEKVMEDHKKGKKHQHRLKNFEKREQASPASTPIVSAEANQKGQNALLCSELCQVDTSSEVTEDHRKSKEQLEKLEEDSPAANPKVSAEAIQKEEDADVEETSPATTPKVSAKVIQKPEDADAFFNDWGEMCQFCAESPKLMADQINGENDLRILEEFTKSD